MEKKLILYAVVITIYSCYSPKSGLNNTASESTSQIQHIENTQKNKVDTIYFSRALADYIQKDTVILFSDPKINFNLYIEEIIYNIKVQDRFIVISHDLNTDKYYLIAQDMDSLYIKLVAINKPIINLIKNNNMQNLLLMDTIYSFNTINIYKTDIKFNRNIDKINIKQNLLE